MKQRKFEKNKEEDLSNVGKIFLKRSCKELTYSPVEKIGVIQVNNFSELRKLAAFRFME